jgi:thiamine-phosphate pyrophosphorylase
MSAPPRDWGVYLVTDRAQTTAAVARVVTAALRGGVGAVQLRERGLETRALLELAIALRQATRAAGAALLINDRIDVALACDADGVHLPGHSFAVADARALLGPPADRCLDASPRRGRGRRRGRRRLRRLRAHLRDAVEGHVRRAAGTRRARPCPAAAALPLFAIGGVDADTAAAVRDAGADGVAVIRAVLAAPDPAAAARALRR